MSHLIATPIVDSRGRATTVHKRPAGTSPGSRSLAAAQPVLKPASGSSIMDEHVSIPGGTPLPDKGIIMSHPGYFESLDIQYARNGYEWRNEDIDITNGDLYGYLRLGIEPVEASVLYQMRITPEDLETDEDLCRYIPGSLASSEKNRDSELARLDDLMERLQEAEVPAPLASKLIQNGLSAWNLKHSEISLEQMTTLLSKWKYDSSSGSDQNMVIGAIMSGKIPFEFVGLNSRADLGRLYHEQLYIETKHELKMRMRDDREKFIRVASKAIKSVRGEHPVRDLFRLVDELGEGVLELKSPKMVESLFDGKPFGIEGAAYLDAVDKSLSKAKVKTVSDWRRFYEHGLKDSNRLITNRDENLDGRNFLALKAEGVPPEQAVDLLVHKGLSLTQALSVVRDGTPVALADGAL